MMRSILHSVYVFLGHVFCKMCLCYWIARDFFSPPKENTILFVSHPDDDTLFFHTFIKKYEPYVVLCTTGWSLRRLPCFFRAMRHYGVRYRAYDLGTRDTRIALLEKHVRSCLRMGKFELVATHSASGEYGHEMHRRVHDAVVKCATVPVLAPVSEDAITGFPLDEDNILEKQMIFNNYYTTERWVLEQYQTWVNNEQLERVVE